MQRLLSLMTWQHYCCRGNGDPWDTSAQLLRFSWDLIETRTKHRQTPCDSVTWHLKEEQADYQLSQRQKTQQIILQYCHHCSGQEHRAPPAHSSRTEPTSEWKLVHFLLVGDCSMHFSSQNWDHVERKLKLRHENNARKLPTYSWLRHALSRFSSVGKTGKSDILFWLGI